MSTRMNYNRKKCYKKYNTKHKEIAYYAVKNGRHPGIYDTWEECQAEVKGYTNAIYKKFYTLEEAVEFTKMNNNKRIIKTCRIHKDASGNENKIYSDLQVGINAGKANSTSLIDIHNLITVANKYDDSDLPF